MTIVDNRGFSYNMQLAASVWRKNVNCRYISI